jgi:hypothetical protein
MFARSASSSCERPLSRLSFWRLSPTRSRTSMQADHELAPFYSKTNDHESKFSEHEIQLKLIQAQISGLQREIHGLKISRGKAIAARERALTKAQAAIDATREVMEHISIH